MKLNRIIYLLTITCLSSLFVACTEQEEIDFSKPMTNVITGNIVQNMTLDSGEYRLLGQVTVKPGATLTINAGVTVKGVEKTQDNTKQAYLIVAKGGKLIVNGTKEAPVVFTTDSDTLKAGKWGGIIINGAAPVNVVPTITAPFPKSSQGGLEYGGASPEDSNAEIKYLRIEYAGDVNKYALELNALGNKSILENIQVYQCSQNGIYFSGGTVNAKNLIIDGSSNDLFSWNNGWNGKGQFWVGYLKGENLTYNPDANCVYGNNPATTNGVNSNPKLSNLTLVSDSTVNNGSIGNIVKFDNGTQGQLFNAILANSKKGIDVRPSKTSDNVALATLEVDYVSSSKVSGKNLYAKLTGDSKDFPTDKRFETSANYKTEVVVLTNDFVGTSPNGIDLSLSDPWFVSTTYKGAVSADNDWTAGWTK